LVLKKLTYNEHVNLKNCEDEPIHLLGKLQSHGILFGFDRDLLVTHVSETALPFFPDLDLSIQKIYLSDLFGEEFKEEALGFVRSNQKVVCQYNKQFSIGGLNYRIAWSRNSGDIYIAELEEATDTDQFTENYLSDLQNFSQSIKYSTNEKDVAVQVVQFFQKLTGFDRVMYYKFDSNHDGEVIAETKVKGLESFLGLRYPASDIPPQARKLYESNITRGIRDVSDEGVPIYGIYSDEPIDLSHSTFRSVSPIHLEYLKNMGVTATHANSILYRGKLWGMVICHHYHGSFHLDFNLRLITELYVDVINFWLVNAQLQSDLERNDLEAKWINEFSFHEKTGDVFDSLVGSFEVLEKTIGISGFTVFSEGVFKHHAQHISNEAELKLLVEKHVTKEDNSSLTLYNHINDFSSERDLGIGGLALFNTGLKEDLFVFLYRPEKKLVYNWAGQPTKEYVQSGSNLLNPRKSFEKWQQIVEGKSEPWNIKDEKFIGKMGDAIDLKEMLSFKKRISSLDNSEQYRVFQMKHTIHHLEKQVEDGKNNSRKVQEEIQQARRVNELKSIVMSNMSHEMRTPLNGIIGLSDLVAEFDNEELKQYGAMIRMSSQRMLKTFTRLMKLDLSEIHSDDQMSSEMSIRCFIDSILQPIKETLINNRQSLSWRIHNREDEPIQNSIILEQIVVNLVNNAIRYGGEDVHAQVDIRTLFYSGNKELSISVEDDGPGIAEEDHHMIFEPFVMGRNVTKRKDEGSGLGLYIVKSYIDYLNGKIQLESKLGEGARFTVSVPL
jgi:light-regulated signal transduction histidine kinase (bacteriophytochrome)